MVEHGLHRSGLVACRQLIQKMLVLLAHRIGTRGGFILARKRILRPQDPYEFQSLRTLRQFIQLEMEAVILGPYRIDVFVLDRLVQLLLDRLNEFEIGFGHIPDGMQRQFLLEIEAQIENLMLALGHQFGYQNALVGEPLHIAFGLQHLQRFAHRRDGDAQFSRNIGLFQLVTTGIDACDDPLAQNFCHMVLFGLESHDDPLCLVSRRLLWNCRIFTPRKYPPVQRLNIREFLVQPNQRSHYR